MVKFFARPRRSRLRAEVIQHQKRRGADFLKPPVISDGAVGAKSGAQVVKQVGHNHKQRRIAHAGAVVGDCRGKVGFAVAVGTGKHNPALRIFGKLTGGVERLAQTFGVAGVKVFVFAQAEVAESVLSHQTERRKFGMTGVVNGAAVVGGIYAHLSNEFGVL